MQPRHLPHLVVLSCLTTAGASAGTVTLLSQERSVRASIDTAAGFLSGSSGEVPVFVRSEAFDSVEAGRFAETAEVAVSNADLPEGVRFLDPDPSTATARQSSNFTQDGGDVRFGLSAFAGTSTDNPTEGAGSAFGYRVSFELEEVTDYALAGTAQASANFVSRFEDEQGDAFLDLLDFTTRVAEQDLQLVFDGTGRDFSTGELLDNTGTLAPGVYEIEIIGSGFTGSSVDFGTVRFDDFGFILRDSTLATVDALTPIPSPAALPAGLALLVGGLMRRRRAA